MLDDTAAGLVSTDVEPMVVEVALPLTLLLLVEDTATRVSTALVLLTSRTIVEEAELECSCVVIDDDGESVSWVTLSWVVDVAVFVVLVNEVVVVDVVVDVAQRCGVELPAL